MLNKRQAFDSQNTRLCTCRLANPGPMFCCLFLQSFFKASLNIVILKLYTKGFTIEFARYIAFANQTTGAGKH